MRNLFIKTMVVASLWFGGASVASSQNILGGILGNVADRMSNKQYGSKTEGRFQIFMRGLHLFSKTAKSLLLTRLSERGFIKNQLWCLKAQAF